MRHLVLLVVSVSLSSCTQSPPGSSFTVGKSTQRIKDADGDWFCHYFFFSSLNEDGREVFRQIYIAPTRTETSPFVREEGTFLLLGRGQERVERPADDGIFVLDESGQLHRADVMPREFTSSLNKPDAAPWETLISSGAWKERLYPLFVQYRWSSKP